jgi:hypothetical protein
LPAALVLSTNPAEALPLIFDTAVALVVTEEETPLTVEVKDVISPAKAVSAFALVVCSVLIAEVLPPTVDVKFVKAVALAAVAVVKVTMLLVAVATFVVLVPTVELKEL